MVKCAYLDRPYVLAQRWPHPIENQLIERPFTQTKTYKKTCVPNNPLFLAQCHLIPWNFCTVNRRNVSKLKQTRAVLEQCYTFTDILSHERSLGINFSTLRQTREKLDKSFLKKSAPNRIWVAFPISVPLYYRSDLIVNLRKDSTPPLFIGSFSNYSLVIIKRSLNW